MDQVLWLDQAEQAAWRSLVIVSNRVRGILDAELVAAHGLPFADYEVFVQLSEAPERRLRMSELAERLHISPSGLTRRLDRLVADGSVSRQQCPSDRRGSFAVLEDKGMARLRDAAPTHVRGVRRHFLERLTVGQQHALTDALAGIMADDPNPSHFDDRAALVSTGSSGAGSR
ncbi:MAG: MarR family winged helix-turn-helix transcriptional regulator [Acidimicrobiales bacterium]